MGYVCYLTNKHIFKYANELLMVTMANLRFVGRISKAGDKLVIIVPKDYHKEAQKIAGKQIRVDVTDEL